MTRNAATIDAVRIVADTTNQSYMNARYFGSLVDQHGAVIGISDCDCVECCWMDPWHPGRKFSLTVIRDCDGKAVTLNHVRNTSFDGWR